MTSFSWRGLTPQLFVIVILPLTALLLLITFGGQYLHRQAMRNLVGERDERAARAAASALSEQLSHRNAAIRGLALRVEDDISADALTNILMESGFLLADFDYGMAFLGTDGKPLASTGDPVFWQKLDATQKGLAPLFSLERPPAFITFFHALKDEIVVITAVREPQNRVIAVGAFSPSLVARSALSTVFSASEGAAAFVVSPDLALLFKMGSLTQEFDLSAHPGVERALAGESGATFLNVNSAEHVIAFSPVYPVGWALVIEEPWEAVTSPLLRTTENAPLILLPALILALLALWFGARRIVQPIQQLENKAAELGWGNFQAIEEPVGGIAEIRKLQAELIHLAQKVKSAQKGLRGYIGAITMGQEEERRRLARELHDDTLQSLIALNQRIQLARLSLNGREGVEMLDEIQGLTEQTIQNLRRFTRALRPIYLEDLGLVAALEMLTQEVQQNSHLAVGFEKSGLQRRLETNQELALYRIAQETLSNVVRHAQATRAEVALQFSDQVAVLEVTDNGRGFEVPDSPAEFAPGGHFGLLGMQERAELIGARLQINSAPGTGTRIRVELPFDFQE